MDSNNTSSDLKKDKMENGNKITTNIKKEESVKKQDSFKNFFSNFQKKKTTEHDDLKKVQQKSVHNYTKTDTSVFTLPPPETTTSVINESPRKQNEEAINNTVEDVIVPVKVDKYDEEYVISLKQRGKAFIFNHKNFEREESREGTEKDVEKLEKTLKELKFKVQIFHDLDYPRIIQLLQEIQRDDHTNEDCIVFFVLTHGNEKREISAYDIYYSIDKLWQPFVADNCPSLAGKPKLFFINACRGKKIDKGKRLFHFKSRTQADGGKTIGYKIPNHADFLIAQSTVDGFLSYRDIENGTWYIQNLCDVLMEYHNTKDLLKILTITARNMAIDCRTVSLNKAEAELTQISSFTSMLIRDVYFRTT